MKEINGRRLIKTFRELLEIDGPARAERPVAEYLRENFSRLGLRMEEDQAAPAIGGNCGNLLVRLPGGKGRLPGLILAAHLDTILPTKDLKIIEKRGAFFSDGSTILGADDRAGVAIILEIARVLSGEGGSPIPLEFLFTVAEENGLLGAKNLKRGWLKGKAAVILDHGAPIGTVIYRAPSGEKIRVTVLGKAAHAGMEPEAGVSAVSIAARAVCGMKLGRIDAETTANIGLIRGGEAVNIVPERVEMFGEARSLKESKLLRQIKQMEAVSRKAAAELGGRVHFHSERDYHGFHLSRNIDLLKLLQRAAARRRMPFIPEVSGGASDANFLNRLGISAVDLSVGYAKPHTKEESIRRNDLIRAAELVYELIKEAGKSDNRIR